MAEGLLDFIRTPEGQGLLATAFGGLAGARRGQPINGLGRAGMSGIMGYGHAVDRQNQMANNDIHRALWGAQIGNYKSEVEQRTAAIEKARIQQAGSDELTNSVLNPTPPTTTPTPTTTPAVDDNKYVPNGMGFTEGNPPIPDSNGVTVTDINSPIPNLNGTQQNSATPSVAARAAPILNIPPQDNGDQADRIAIAKLVKARWPYKDAVEMVNAGKPQVAHYVDATDDQGRLGKQGKDKFGNNVGGFSLQGQSPDSASIPRSFKIGPNGEYIPNTPFIDYELRKAREGANNISFGTPMAGTDSKGNSVYFQPSKGGGAPSIIRGITPSVDGRIPAGYRSTPEGNLQIIPGGPFDTKEQAKSSAQETGRENVSSTVAALRDSYRKLQASGGITDPNKSAVSNMSAGSASSATGQAVGRFFGTQNQSERNTIAMTRPGLLQHIMKATGMSAKQMDSNAELKLWLSTATDSSLDVAANMKALDNIERVYGVKDGSETLSQRDMTGGFLDGKQPPKPMKGMLRNGYKFKGGNPADQANWERQ